MRFDLESWRKLYVKESLEHRSMSLLARGLRDYLVRFAEPDGTLLRGEGRVEYTDLARVLGASGRKETDAAVDAIHELVTVDYLSVTDDRLWITKFTEAQGARSPGAKRQAAYIERRKHGDTSDVTGDVSNDTEGDARMTSQKTRRDENRKDEREPATPAPRARKAPRLAPVNCPWPAEFEPDETCRIIAQTAGIKLDSELSKARDWATASGKRCKDWQAFFRNWLRKSADFATRHGPIPVECGPEAAALIEQAKAGKLGERAKRWAESDDERAIDELRKIAAERRRGGAQATLGQSLPRQP